MSLHFLDIWSICAKEYWQDLVKINFLDYLFVQRHDHKDNQLVCEYLYFLFLDSRSSSTTKKPERAPELQKLRKEESKSYLPEIKKSPPPTPPSKRTPGTAYLMLDKLRNTTQTSYLRCVISFVKMMNVLALSDPQMTTLSKELINEILVSWVFLCIYPI